MSATNKTSAFPHPFYGCEEGMTLRDYFAAIVDKDEYGELLYRNATHELKEAWAGKCPEEPPNGVPLAERVAYRVAHVEWEMRVRAALRYRMADAMLAERSKPTPISVQERAA